MVENTVSAQYLKENVNDVVMFRNDQLHVRLAG